MKDIIQWLQEMEMRASEVYRLAADSFANDPELKKFLEVAADEEDWHLDMIGSALEHLASEPAPVSAISMDDKTRAKILNNFSDLWVGLERNTISRDQLIEKIVELEFSEWNDIFIYIIDLLHQQDSKFQHTGARIQSHIEEIESFLESSANSPELKDKIAKIRDVWPQNILIVDDEELITDLLKSLLKTTGYIDIARNGQEAMRLIESKNYMAIISDIDMPIMDGISLFREAVDKFPELKNRFMFLSGDLSPERKQFFRKNSVKCLAKPFDINTLMEEVSMMTSW